MIYLVYNNSLFNPQKRRCQPWEWNQDHRRTASKKEEHASKYFNFNRQKGIKSKILWPLTLNVSQINCLDGMPKCTLASMIKRADEREAELEHFGLTAFPSLSGIRKANGWTSSTCYEFVVVVNIIHICFVRFF